MFLGAPCGFPCCARPCRRTGTRIRGERRFTYALLPFSGPFEQAAVVHSAYEPIPSAVEWAAPGVRDRGTRPALFPYRSVNHHRNRAIRGVYETDMLEENGRAPPFTGNAVPLTFKPFKIKTLVIRFQG
ncbi:MAG: hypothetical protein LBQ88_21325 [Treponema sp.]|nr:hypothetical protein [Treponema sp.]